MRKLILGVVVISLTVISFSVDTTYELTLHSSKRKDNEVESSVNGKMILYKDSEDYSFNVEYNFGDNINRIDLAKLKLYYSKIDLEIGRNRMGWGTGYSFNPTDIYNSSPVGSAFDSNYLKKGRDSLIVTYYPTMSIQIQGVYAFPTKINENFVRKDKSEEYGLRIKTYISDYMISGIYGHKSKEEVNVINYGQYSTEAYDMLGLNFSGNIPVIDLKLWGENAYNMETKKVSSSLGIDRYFGDYYFNVEYYRNGDGVGQKSEYDFIKIDSGSVSIGKNYLKMISGEPIGRDYLIPSLKYDVDEKTSIAGYSFININDSSGVGGITLDYLYDNNVKISLLPYYIFGENDAEYDLIKDDYGKYGADINIKVIF